MELQELMNDSRWLHLVSIADEGKNRLRAVVCFAEFRKSAPREIIGKHVSEILNTPLDFPKVPHFELTWNRYLLFMTSDESYTARSKDEIFDGHAVRKYRRSWLLSSFPQLIVSPLLPAEVIHWGIYGLNHIVDVLAYEEPTIRCLGVM